MKGNRLFGAIIKSFLSVTGIFVVGYLGYHYPDAMIVVISCAVFFAFSWYFYKRDEET